MIHGQIAADTLLSATGFPLVLEGAYYSLDTKGSFVQVGGPVDPKYRLTMDVVQHLFRGVKLFGCVEGDSVPGDFIPELIKYYREGRLPGMLLCRVAVFALAGLLICFFVVDKMVKYYDAKDFKTALHVSGLVFGMGA